MTTTVERNRPRGAIRRAQILDGAIAVFLEYGYSGATIDLVVARIGASKATIYSFFGGKEGLFEALVSEYAERILAGFADLDGGIIDVRAALKSIAQRYLEVLMAPDAVALWRLIVAEGPRFPALAQGPLPRQQRTLRCAPRPGVALLEREKAHPPA